MSTEQIPLQIQFTGQFGFTAYNTEDKEWYGDALVKLLMYKESIGEPIPSKWKIYQLGGELKEQRDELLELFKMINSINTSWIGDTASKITLIKARDIFNEKYPSKQD